VTCCAGQVQWVTRRAAMLACMQHIQWWCIGEYPCVEVAVTYLLFALTAVCIILAGIRPRSSVRQYLCMIVSPFMCQCFLLCSQSGLGSRGLCICIGLIVLATATTHSSLCIDSATASVEFMCLHLFFEALCWVVQDLPRVLAVSPCCGGSRQ
jgi:hypothetical protein